MGEILPDTFKPMSEYKGLLIWSKGLAWLAWNSRVWLRGAEAGRSGQAPIGHLHACCLSWPTPGVLSINSDAAGCHAGRQGRAAGLRKVAGANFSRVLACGNASEEVIQVLLMFLEN
eukprot:181126-Pelagomonas_calceolata.AAC.1